MKTSLKFSRSLWILVVGALVLAAGIWTATTADYMRYRDVPVTVFGKLQQSGRAEPLVMVFRQEDGSLFDRHVSATTFMQFNAGDRVVLNLRPMDIHQTRRQNLLYFFAPIFAIPLGLALIMGGVIDWLANRLVRKFRDKMTRSVP